MGRGALRSSRSLITSTALFNKDTKAMLGVAMVATVLKAIEQATIDLA